MSATLEDWKGSALYWAGKCIDMENLTRASAPDSELERNAKYRAEAIKPIVDELKALREDIRATNDLLAEVLKEVALKRIE